MEVAAAEDRRSEAAFLALEELPKSEEIENLSLDCDSFITNFDDCLVLLLLLLLASLLLIVLTPKDRGDDDDR